MSAKNGGNNGKIALMAYLRDLLCDEKELGHFINRLNYLSEYCSAVNYLMDENTKTQTHEL